MPIISPRLSVVTPPDTLPVSLAEAKLQLRIDGAEQDGLLAGLLDAAVAQCQQRVGTSLCPRLLAYSCTNSGQAGIDLPAGPVQEIISLEALAEDGGSSVIAASDYRLEPDMRRLTLPARNGGAYWRATYRAGYETETLPADLRQAVLHRLVALYEEGELSMHYDRMAERLLQPYRELSL